MSDQDWQRTVDRLADERDAALAALAQERDRADAVRRSNAALVEALDAEREWAERLRAVLVESVIPYEALLADTESRKWIAPSIWKAMEDFRDAVRRLVSPPATEKSPAPYLGPGNVVG